MRKSIMIAAAVVAAGISARAQAQTFALSLGVRETDSSGAIGENGGTANATTLGAGAGIEWINKDNQFLPADGAWHQFTWTLGTDTVSSFTGNSVLQGAKGVLEHVRILNSGQSTAKVTLDFDEFQETVGGTTTVISDFETDDPARPSVFQNAYFSGSTQVFIQPGATTETRLNDAENPAHNGVAYYRENFNFASASNAAWCRLTTFGPSNPAIQHLNPILDFTSGSVVSMWVRLSLQQPAHWFSASNDGNWTDAAKWTDGIVPNAIGAAANLLEADAPQTIAVDGDILLNTLNIDSTKSYTLNGPNSLNFDGGNGFLGNVSVKTGTHTINAAVNLNKPTNMFIGAGASLSIPNGMGTPLGPTVLNKQGAGVLSVGTTELGTLTLNAGTMTLTNSNASVVIDVSGTGGRLNLTHFNTGVGGDTTTGVFVRTGSTLALIAGGGTAGTSKTTQLTISGAGIPTATLDLADHGVIVDYEDGGASPITTIRNQIKTAYASGAWTGLGITSSLAASVAANAGNTHKTAIGFAEKSTVLPTPGGQFLGVDVDDSAVVMRYTYVGDSNLDGTVATADFTTLGTNFGATGMSWAQGDSNFDGTVNALDFNAVATNFGQVLPSPVLGSLVPEPIGITAIALAAMMGSRRTRRCN